MRHFALKFNHGVEIGAMCAYLGHFQRTGDPKILRIARDEKDHQRLLAGILRDLNSSPSLLINGIFYLIGHCIFHACKIAPLSSLNWVARTLEIFAVSTYEKLAVQYPTHSWTLLDMAEKEEEHRKYFSNPLTLQSKTHNLSEEEIK